MADFFWGAGGQKLSATEVARNRAVAEALMNRVQNPQNMWEGLQSAAGDIGGSLLNWKSDKAEEEGRSAVADALLQAQGGSDPNAYISVLGNEFASPAQSAVAQALLQRGWSAEDRQAEWERQDALRADDRAYEAPVRDLQLESGQFTLDQARTGYRSLVDPADRAAEGIDPADTRPWQKGADGKLYDFGSGKDSGQTINVNTGGSDDFYKKLDTDAGAAQAALMDAGRNAASNNIRLGQLEELLQTAPQGASGGIVQMVGKLGIPVDGLDEVQAAQALINQMVPGQRPPGSGTMSDADLALFKQSLPSIINQPGGNTKILQTARAINEYTIQQARIAEMVANREISPAEGRAMQAAVPNPLIEQTRAAPGTGGEADQAFTVNSDAEYDALPSGAVFVGPDGKKRRKP